MFHFIEPTFGLIWPRSILFSSNAADTPKVNRFFQADAPGQIFFEHRPGLAPTAPSPVEKLQESDSHGPRRMSAIRARRGSVGTPHFYGLGRRNSESGVLKREGDEVEPNFSVDVSSQRGGGTALIEDTWGHLHAGFGGDLTTRNPVVYFTKLEYDGGRDCKVSINPYKVDIKVSTYCVPACFS